MQQRRLQVFDGAWLVAPRDPEQALTAFGGCHAPDPVERFRAALESIQQCGRPSELSERDKCLERIGKEPQADRLADAMRFPEASERFCRKPRTSWVVDRQLDQTARRDNPCTRQHVPG